MEIYFAYGSNINARQMRERCPSVKFLSTGILKGYRIAFVLQSERWGGGVAGIVPEIGEQTEGIVYQMSREDLRTLDKFEGVDKGHYYRKRIDVLCRDGKRVEAWVYIANYGAGARFSPSKKYLETMIEGATEHQLSEQFIKSLERLKGMGP